LIIIIIIIVVIIIIIIDYSRFSSLRRTRHFTLICLYLPTEYGIIKQSPTIIENNKTYFAALLSFNVEVIYDIGCVDFIEILYFKTNLWLYEWQMKLTFEITALLRAF